MGTRHLISIYVDGEAKLAQYGQWDGNPGGQGTTIVNFLRGADLDRFKAQVQKARMIGEEERQALWVAAGASPDDDFVSMGRISYRFKKANPQLSRDSGAGTLGYIMEAEEPLVSGDSTAFAADSLFCEWAYVIDLDEMTFEVYKGFQHGPHSEGRFADMPYEPPEHRQGRPQEYWPVARVAAFPVEDIPSYWIEVVEGGPLEALASTAKSQEIRR